MRLFESCPSPYTVLTSILTALYKLLLCRNGPCMMPVSDMLVAYADAEPIGDERNSDGKSLHNPPAARLSPAYDAFPAPIRSDRNGFDFHGAIFSSTSYPG